MPGGFLQLLATGKESEYLNDTPDISFFKCYFRRHTNFFINNVEIYSNYYENSNVNTFLIPKSGDLLSKSYLKFNYDENYIEILGNYETMVSTLTNDITLFLDSYNIYVNEYNKSNISNINNVKFILTFNNIQYLSLMSTYITDELNLIFKIKFDKYITFQMDQTNIFYNINLPYNYYGFNYYVDYNALYNSIKEPYNILSLLTNNINYQSMRYFRLDLSNLNIAFKFTFDDINMYQYLFNYCLQNLDMTSSTNIIKINQYDIYVSLSFNLTNSIGIQLLIKTVNLIKGFYNGYSNIKARYYTNKIKYSDLVIKSNELTTFVNNMFGMLYITIYNNFTNQNNTSTAQTVQLGKISPINNNYLYYNIIFPSINLYDYASEVLNNPKYLVNPNFIEMDIFNLKDNLIFGNLDTNDFNGSLITNETNLINSSNINSTYSLSLNTYIRLIVNLFCDNLHNPTIQEFLTIINDPVKIINYFYNSYANNTKKFNKIILDTIIHNNVLFLNTSSIRSILYQNVSYNYYNEMITQFVSKKISSYENTIINNYIFYNIFNNINSNNYCVFNINRLLVQSIILSNYANLNFTDIPTINFFYTYLSNYDNNNNVFDLLLYNYFSGYSNNQPIDFFNLLNDIYQNLENFLYYTIYLTELIINTNVPLYNIYNKNANAIYSSNGLIQQVVSENPYNILVFPLSSTFFFYTSNIINSSDNKNNYNVYCNIDRSTYEKNIKNAMYQLYSEKYQRYNYNLDNVIKNFSDAYDYFNGLYIETVISNYYNQNQNYLTAPNYASINNFIDTINNINSYTIYNDNNVDYSILYYLFKIADSSLLNNSFSNYDTTYPKTNTFYFTNATADNYLKFIFLPNSPYYRLYYLYNFLTTMTVDKTLINEMPYDLIQLRDLILLILIQLTNSYTFTNTSTANINVPPTYNFSNFNTNIFFTFNVYLNNYFICYDNINILNNQQIKDLFNNGELSKDLYIYAPFYFLTNNVYISQNSVNNNNVSNQGVDSFNGFDISNLLANLYYSIKFNFDDTIIYSFLVTLKNNQQYFVNIDNVISFVNTFLNKSNNDFTSCTDILNTIITSNNQYNNKNLSYNPTQFTNNTYYSNCYYTSYSIGAMFDNVNSLIINTINELYSIPNKLINIDMYSLLYTNTTFDIKKYQNILTSEQISDGFVYYKKLLFEIDISIGSNVFSFLQSYLNGIFKYIFDNFTYLINYIISDYVFRDLLLALDNAVSLYNSKNNTNIDLYNYLNTLYNINIQFTNNKFQTNSIIVVYLLYYLFSLTCLKNDIDNYVNNNSSLEIQTFNTYIVSLYSQNIYLGTLENFISIINNSTEKLTFNYSTIYIQNIANGQISSASSFYSQQPSVYNVIFNNTTTYNNNNLFENKINNFDITTTDANNLYSRTFINQYNINDVVTWNQLNTNVFYGVMTNYTYNYNTAKQLSYNTEFYNRYSASINAILNQNEKLLFISSNKFFLNYISSNNLVGTDLFTIYNDYISTIYDESISIINNLYNNLSKSFKANNKNNYLEYQSLLINQILGIILKFYDTSISKNNTYSHTLMFSSTKPLLKENSVLGSVLNNNLYDTTSYKPTIPDFNFLRDFVIRYFNLRITSSINIEKNINRYIYIYINNYIIQTNRYDESLIKYMNENSLYDYVKMFNNIYLKSNNIVYDKNLSLYQNDIIFEILNYDNYTDNKCFLQNPIFNDFITNFSLYPGDLNSFYINFKRFLHFLKEYNHSDLFKNFNLSNGTNIIDYYLNVFNVDDMNTYIYEFINLTEAFSPISIYDNIVFLKKEFHNNSISSKMTINFDNIMKKIFIYLFMIYLINANLFNIINDNIISKIIKNHTLEYTLPNAKININLNKVFDSAFYNKLKKYIYHITVFDKNYPSVYKTNSSTNSTNEFTNASYFYDIKNNTNASDFLNLCTKYVSSYEETIGFNKIYTNATVIQNQPNDITISKLVQSYNVMLNLDQSSNNTNPYFLTNATLITLNTFYDTQIQDINSINKEINNSDFIVNMEKYYTKTQLKNTNIFLILLVELLNKYNVTYPNQHSDLNNIIANFWIGTFNISQIIEELKGYTSDKYIKNNTINFSETKNLINENDYLSIQDSPYIFSRSQNVTDLSQLISATNNYSNIMPTDYDYDVINFNMKSIYNDGIDIYKKYYHIDYNFYQFEQNYIPIYNSKFTYYSNVINNNYALLNIQQFNKDLFNKVFIEIIYTWFSQPYINYEGNNTIFQNNFNQLIKLYIKYFFTFKINQNLTDVDNLKLQNVLRSTSTQNLTLLEIGNYIKQLYFYELFGLPYVPTIQTGTVTDNFTDFVKIIESSGNYNIEFVNITNNFVFNLENSIILINWYLIKYFSIDTENNIIILKNCINYFIDEFASFSNVSLYFKNSNLYYSQINSPFLFSKIVNTINYTDFINRFSKAIRQIIYYTDNISWSLNLKNIYLTYFENVKFYYKKYTDNDDVIMEYTISLTDLQQYTYLYITYIIQNAKCNNNISNLYLIFKNIITNTLLQTSFDKINIVYNWIFSTKSRDITADNYIDIFSLELYNLLINGYCGIIYSYYNDIVPNINLNFKILLINYGMMIINNPNLTIDYIYQTNYKLEILYRLEIFYIYTINYSDSIFQQYLFYTLTDCNKFLYNDSLFDCINLENDMTTYLDFINKNIINKNLISNYYKTIQNQTIKEIINYKVNIFYNYNVNSSFLSNIYNNITIKLVQQDETSIINIFIQNSIINILNQYNSETYNYSILKSNIQYIGNIFDTIIQKISMALNIIKSIFGGTNKTDTAIRVSVTQLLNIFSNQTYNYDNNIINIFTLIYDNFNNLGIERINYNMLITLFYYICMIIYILNKVDNITNQYLFNNNEKIIYELINYINIQIYNYNNSIDTVNTNIFFNGLNELFFNIYDNQTFTVKIIVFFDSIVQISKVYKEEILQEIKTNGSIKTYSGGNLTIDGNSYINNMLYKKYVPYNKILIWQNMLVNIVDANLSKPIYYMKSLMYDTLFNIPATYVEQITKVTGGLFADNGMINLINNLQLYITDELIDTISNTMLIIIKDLMTNINVLTALNQMLGIGFANDFIKQGPIKPYIYKSYKNTSLYLPLEFFFKKNMNALPLISCMYSDILIRINNSKKTLFKDFYDITFLLQPNKRIKTSMLLDFILLERTERKRLTLNKQDNLIEKHNYYTVSQIITNQINPNDDFMYVNFDFNINGLIKEIFWTVDFFINGYLIENNNFGTTNIFNMILSTVFYIDGIKRDGIVPLSTKNIVSNVNTTNYSPPNPNNPGDSVINTFSTYNYNNITRLLNPYRYNTRVNSNNNINSYSFSFEPEKFQPTGAINMDMYNTFRIQLIIDKNKFLSYFGNITNVTNLDSIMISINLTTLEYNLIRYQSGLAGLLFMK